MPDGADTPGSAPGNRIHDQRVAAGEVCRGATRRIAVIDFAPCGAA